MRAFLLLLAALPAPQEAPWAAWLEDLDSPDPVRVHRALEGLTAAGADACRRIEDRAAGAKGERRRRLEDAAREARLALENALVPPTRRVSLKAVDRPALDVLFELQARTGLPLELEALQDQDFAPVTVDVADATALEALEAVARAASLAVAFDPGRIGLSADGHADAPRSAYGPLLFLLHQYEENRTLTFRRKPEASTYLTGELRIEPWLPVVRLGPPRLREAVDDRGADLRLPADEEDAPAEEEILQQDRVLPVADGLPLGVDLRLRPLGPDAVRIAVLRGDVPVTLPSRGATAVFEAPAEGQRRAGAGFEAEIQSLNPEGQLQILIRGLAEGGPSRTWAVAVVVDGVRMFARPSLARDEKGLQLYLEYDRPWAREGGDGPPRRKSVKPDRVELTLVTAVQVRRFPFEFRGLRIR